jgi:hypothetical protein
MQAAAGAMELPVEVKEKLDDINKKARLISSPQSRPFKKVPSKGSSPSKAPPKVIMKEKVIVDTKTFKPRTSFVQLPKDVEDELHKSRAKLELQRKKNMELKQSIAPQISPLPIKNTWK